MHVIEPAASGRAKCRGCSRPIAKGELRFGERLPSPFVDDEVVTLWFHLLCGAYKRPESLLEILSTTEGPIPNRALLESEAEIGKVHRRLPRVDGAERAPTGRATCRSCRKPIDKGTWRIRLVYFEEIRFAPSGFVHAACAKDYLEATAITARVAHFSPDLEPSDLESFREAMERS